MKPLVFVAQGESSNTICGLCRSLYGLKQSPVHGLGIITLQFVMIQSDAYHSLFYHHSPNGCIYLIVYDGIVITSSVKQGIVQVKQYFTQKFQTKNLSHLRYFLRSATIHGWFGHISKYALDIIETGMINVPIDTLMPLSVKLAPDQGGFYSGLGRYKRLVGKLNYLTVTHPNIVFVVSQCLNSPCQDHWM